MSLAPPAARRPPPAAAHSSACRLRRVVCEVSAPGAGGALSAEGACALVCVALGRAPPAELSAPSASDLAAALETVSVARTRALGAPPRALLS